MALTYIAGAANSLLVFGLSSDTKPATPSDGWVFIETDTGRIFGATTSAWFERVDAARKALASDFVVPAATSCVVLRQLTITSGVKVVLGSGAILRIL